VIFVIFCSKSALCDLLSPSRPSVAPGRFPKFAFKTGLPLPI
jgi:hypothetical protein